MTIRGFLCAAGAALGLVAGAAAAQDGPDYVKQDFGFNGCSIDWGPLLAGNSLDDMKRLATENAALGFTIHPDAIYSHLLVGSFPKDCREPANLSWPLYLAEGHVRDYALQDFGFNGCDVTFGPLMEDTDEDAMVLAARLANAVGFTYHQGLAFGKVIVGPYPAGCKSPSSLSWPLYLAK